MSAAPVVASPAPLPVFPVPPLLVDADVALADAAATVVVVVELPLAAVVDVVEPPLAALVEVEAEVADSSSSSVATFRSAATMADVGGAAPKVASSDWPIGPTTNRMYWANF